MADYTHITHEFEPVYNENSQILILGTLPSVKSREQHFYYGHPRNRFWQVLASIVQEPLPQTIDEKKEFLLRNRIAVWDVIAECDIIGSSDSSIRNVVPTDVAGVLRETNIARVYANGAKAYELYRKYTLEMTGMPICKLPSTSPANAAFGVDRLVEEWKIKLKI